MGVVTGCECVMRLVPSGIGVGVLCCAVLYAAETGVSALLVGVYMGMAAHGNIVGLAF